MSNLVPVQPIRTLIDNLVTRDLSVGTATLPANAALNHTILLATKSGGVHASTLASILMCLLVADHEPLFVQIGGALGYAYRSHPEPSRLHCDDRDPDALASAMNFRLRRPNQIAILEFASSSIREAIQVAKMLGQELQAPAPLIYIADKYEDSPPFVQLAVREGLRHPLIVREPLSLFEAPGSYLPIPRLPGSIADRFYKDHVPVRQAIQQSDDLGAKALLSPMLRSFHADLMGYING